MTGGDAGDVAVMTLNTRCAGMNGVWLKFKDIVFLVPDEFKGLDLSSLSESFDLTRDLDGAMRNAPYDLSGAPIISWILGRMAYLSAAPDFPRCEVRKDSELGEIRIRFLVIRGSVPVAKLRIGIVGGKTEFSGKASSMDDAILLLSDFLTAMLDEPEDLMDISISAKALELGGHKNEYGVVNGQLLGSVNIYE